MPQLMDRRSQGKSRIEDFIEQVFTPPREWEQLQAVRRSLETRKPKPDEYTAGKVYPTPSPFMGRAGATPPTPSVSPTPPTPATTPPPVSQAREPVGDSSQLMLIAKIKAMRDTKKQDVMNLLQWMSQEGVPRDAWDSTISSVLGAFEASGKYMIPELEAYKATQAERIAGMQEKGREKVARIGATTKEAKPEIELKERLEVIQKEMQRLTELGEPQDSPKMKAYEAELYKLLPKGESELDLRIRGKLPTK